MLKRHGAPARAVRPNPEHPSRQPPNTARTESQRPREATEPSPQASTTRRPRPGGFRRQALLKMHWWTMPALTSRVDRRLTVWAGWHARISTACSTPRLNVVGGRYDWGAERDTSAERRIVPAVVGPPTLRLSASRIARKESRARKEIGRRAWVRVGRPGLEVGWVRARATCRTGRGEWSQLVSIRPGGLRRTYHRAIVEACVSNRVPGSQVGPRRS
jgi:hypothetical protein